MPVREGQREERDSEWIKDLSIGGPLDVVYSSEDPSPARQRHRSGEEEGDSRDRAEGDEERQRRGEQAVADVHALP